jgi:hypothetical protein
MTAPAVREFEIFERGQIRDLILDYFRSGLRRRVNPETNQLFTDDEIARATCPGTRWYVEAQAIDDYSQAEQRRALYINDQLRINRATTQWLEEFHARQWDPDGRLKASPGSGLVTVSGNDGIRVVASATIPDLTAYWGTTASGVRVQVFAADEAIGATVSGQTTVTMVAMDPGSNTNLAIGEVITWAQRDPGMSPMATVASNFTGGFDVETDADWASRMEGNQRHKAGSGNDAQQRAWGRAASNAIEDCFIYPCAFGDGSFEACVVAKRTSGDRSPTARTNAPIPVLRAAIAQLTPPGSPVEPTPPNVVVVTPWIRRASFGIRLSLLAGSDSGWRDSRPFPNRSSTVSVAIPYIVTAAGSVARIYAQDDDTLPGGLTTLTGADNCPHMMGWVETESRWMEFPPVHDIARVSAGEYDVTFMAAIASTAPWLVPGVYVSPYTALHQSIADSIIEYMDERGPGEILDEDDYRYSRSSRFPALREEKPYRVGSEVATRVLESLVGAASDADAPHITTAITATPALLAPQMHVLGRVGIYPLI